MSKKLSRILALAGVGLAIILLVGGVIYTELQKVPHGDCGAHADADDNGRCDNCNQDLLVRVDIYAINDLHGKFLDNSAQPGVDELTTFLGNRSENRVLISSGDMWQGSSESNLSGGNIITTWMNEIGFDSMTLGNHEFDWGTDLIRANVEIAEFPVLAINVYSRETRARVSYCRPSAMVEKNGLKIGIIGAVGDVYSSIASYMAEDVYFLTGRDLTKLVKEEAMNLRNQGADIIIYSIHDGYGDGTGSVRNVTSSDIYDYYDITLSDYVDICFEAHTHQHYILRDSRGVYHLQGGGENRGISHAEVAVNSVTGKVSVLAVEFVPNSIYARAASSPLRDEIYERYFETVARGRDNLGRNTVRRGADELKQLVADLYLKAGLEQWGEEYNIVLGGGFISIRSPYELPTGTVTYANVQMLFPFDNRLVLCKVQGRYLRSQFLETDNSNYFVTLTDYGKLVRDHLDNDAYYYIVIDRYSSTYKPNNCTEVDYYEDGIYARDLLANYFMETLPGGSGAVTYTVTPVSEIMEIGRALAKNERTKAAYYIEGKIVSIENTSYGNVYIQDAAGDRIYVYGINSLEGGLRYDQMKNPPKVGDTVVLSGQIQRYIPSDGTEMIEMYKAVLVEKK